MYNVREYIKKLWNVNILKEDNLQEVLLLWMLCRYVILI